MHNISKKGEKYQGNLDSCGKKHGFGCCEFDNGDFYIGQYVNGKKDGKGFNQSKNGAYYYGDFKQSRYEGKGEYMYESSDKFVCQWEKGFPVGLCVVTSAYGKKFDHILKNPQNFEKEIHNEFQRQNKNINNRNNKHNNNSRNKM